MAKRSRKKPETYEQLRDRWYKKLEKSGYEDIEQTDGNLKRWAVEFNGQPLQDLYRRNAPYYVLATKFLSEYKFKSRREEIIWEYHSNAISIRDIVKLLKKVRINIERDTVWQTVKRLEKSMKIMYMVDSSDEGESQ